MRKIYILKNWNNIPLDESKTSQILDISKLELSQCYNLQWSPDGKWIAYSAYKTVKIRPGSTIWEADFDEILEKLAK